MVISRPKPLHAAQNTPTLRQPLFAVINWAQRTEGAKGRMVKINTATYLPRCLVGAISDVAANAVSSLTPAPAPAIVIPPVSISSSMVRNCRAMMFGTYR